MFRVVGDVGPGDPKGFGGDLVHYQFEDGPDGRREWVSRLVPHIYMDDEGRVARNSYAADSSMEPERHIGQRLAQALGGFVGPPRLPG